jgi:hypothetical protein
MTDMPSQQAMQEASTEIDAYWEALRTNPPIQETHQINLTQISARFGVELEVGDVDQAIKTVNERHQIQPPVRWLGTYALKDPKTEFHLTSATGVAKHYVNTELFTIAALKGRGSH